MRRFLGVEALPPNLPLGGVVQLKVPANSDSGKQLRLAGRGLPKPGGGAGDLYAIAQIVVPAATSASEQDLYEQLKSGSTFEPRARFAQELKHAN